MGYVADKEKQTRRSSVIGYIIFCLSDIVSYIIIMFRPLSRPCFKSGAAETSERVAGAPKLPAGRLPTACLDQFNDMQLCIIT